MIGAGETAGVHKHAGKPGRIKAGEGALRMRAIRQAHGAHAAIAPRLLTKPHQCVVTILGFVEVFGEHAFRSIAPAAILHHHGKAMCCKFPRNVSSRARCQIRQ